MEKLGATGEFPQGKICKDDEGEIRLAVAAVKEQGVVAIDFGTPVKWLALPKKEALEFAEIIRKNAEKLDE
jgi:hypothetical protein